MALRSTVALVRERMMLVAAAAPPATPTPVLLPPEIAAAAANTCAVMAESEVACTRTSPSVLTLGRFTKLAVTTLSMRFCASARPIATDTAEALGLTAMLAAAAIAWAWIVASSVALTLMPPAAVTVAVPVGLAWLIVASTVLPMSLKLSAPVALAATALPLALTDRPSAMPKASESMVDSLPAATVTVPPAPTLLSSTAARVVLAMSFSVSEKPSPAAVLRLLPTAACSTAEPAVASICESSSAVMSTAPTAVRLLPLRARACVLARILLAEAEPARLPAIAEPPAEPPTLPAAPIASEKMSAAMSASIVTAPPERMVEWSTSAQTRLAWPSVPMLLTENAAPTAPALPLP